jgi:hypothetical protein
MANALYGKYRRAFLTGAAPDLRAVVLRWLLVDSAQYAPNLDAAAGHEFLSDVPVGARLTSTAPLSNVSVAGATLDADDPAIVDPGGGGTAEFLILYVDTGNAATSRLLLFVDTAAGLPLTLDGTNDTVQHNAAGILAA